MPISSLRIKNFRSLADASLDAKALTVLVGCNDEGKSNVLRALDLFFNGEKGKYEFNWIRDYSGFAKSIRNKAPQIDILLTITLPSSFSIQQDIVWRRSWRQNGFHSERIELADGKDLPSRSKAYAYLKAIRYEYVPAIKGPEYFEHLLASVHDMLDATVQSDIRSAAATFTGAIRRHTDGILSDLEQQLGLKSDLELPTDLKRLFSELEFRSSVGSSRVALAQRGDGIKVRHIPIILRWLAQQANHLAAPGKPRAATIWGYEEPENNLEVRRCFELANFFQTNSNSVQTFLTTHSPVFYSVFHTTSGDNISLAEVKLDENIGTVLCPRKIGQASDVEALHSSIGFLDLLEPHVLQWKERVDRLEARIEEGVSTDHPTIFVEGPSDRSIIRAMIRRSFKEASDVRVVCSTQNGGGHAWVKDSLIAWHHQRPQKKAIGLFDADDASAPSLAEFKEIVEARADGRTKAFKYRIKQDGPAHAIVRAGVRLQTAIEELCPIECWVRAAENGWLEDRNNLPQLYNFAEVDVTFNQWLAEKLPDAEHLQIAQKRISTTHKEAFATYVAGRITDTSCPYDFQPIHRLVGVLLAKLNLNGSS